MPETYDDLLRRIRKLEGQISKTSTADKARPIVSIAGSAVAQSFPNSTLTIVQYDTVEYDAPGAITTGAAWKYTAPIDGFYHVNASMIFDLSTTWAAGEFADMRLFVGGVFYRSLDRDDEMTGPASQYKRLGGSVALYLAAGAYFDIRCIQASGGALPLLNSAAWNYIDIHKIN